MATEMYRLENVSVRYGSVHALRNISLSIAAGERLAIIGPSGAGKSTLLGLLNASIDVTEGEVFVDQQALARFDDSALKRHRSRVGFVYQQHNLIPTLRVIQNVMAARLGRFSLLGAFRRFLYTTTAEQEEVFALLKRLGIEEKIFQFVEQLSGGQRQRVAIARALYQEPHTLLADEPVASLDPARARETLALFSQIALKDNLTLCMSLHQVELADELIDRVIGIREGELVLDTTSAALTQSDLDSLYSLGG